jgi:hypothetical protein
MQVTHCRIAPPPGMTVADRPLVSGSDGYHFHSHYGDVLFENNEVCLTDDDPISIKNGLYHDVAFKDDRTLLLDAKFSVGDEIEIRNSDLTELARRRVAAVSRNEITLDNAVPQSAGKKFVVIHLKFNSAHWILRGNNFHDFYGRIMLYTWNGTVERNRFQHTLFHIGSAATDWDNSGVPHDLVVRDNFFEETNADASVWAAWPAKPVFKNILFRENSFLQGALSINHTQNAALIGNYFDFSTRGDGKAKAAITLVNTAPCQLYGTTVLGGQDLPVVSSDKKSEYDEKGTVRKRATMEAP